MSKQLLQRIIAPIRTLLSSKVGNLLIFFIICAISYGIFIPFLGFYWDDWGFIWLNEFHGAEGLEKYFSTNRPFWAGMFQFTLNLIGLKPLYWHIFAFTMRYLNIIAFWWLLRLIWPKREFFTFTAVALFIVYPGFSQQAVAITYSHFLIVQLMVILSFGTMILAVEKKKPTYLWWTISLLFALVHQFTMEYFFALEILRLVILWIKIDQPGGWKARAKRVTLSYLPYLAISVSFIYWRVFVLSFQTYQPSLISDVSQSPLPGLGNLVVTVFSDVFLTGIMDWFATVPVILGSEAGTTTKLILWGGMIATGIVGFISFSLKNVRTKNRKWSIEPLVFSLLGLFIAGGPFWLTNLEIGFNSISDRFAFPMMMVASILMASLLFLLFQNKPRALSVAAAIILMFGVGFQINAMSVFRQEWKNQQALYKQLEWRIPQLEPKTLIFSPEMDFPHMSDNSFTGPINWLFSGQLGSENTEYLLAYIPLRIGENLPELSPGQTYRKDLLVNLYVGSTSQVITINYSPPGCVRVFDGDRDGLYPNITDEFRKAIALSDPKAWITNTTNVGSLPNIIVTLDETANNWCYYFQKADLAAQLEEWDQVVDLGEIAFSIGDIPNDPTERIPFIQGYAYTGDWARAEKLSLVIFEINDMAAPMICELWATMIGSSPDPEANSHYAHIIDTLSCEDG
jgi:hypothetical protein